MNLPAWYIEWDEAGRDYRAGFLLLQQHGACSPQMMHLLGGFARGGWVPRPERETLEGHLLAAAKSASTTTKAIPTAAPPRPIEPPRADKNGKKGDEPPEIVALRAAAIPLHKEHSHLHALLTAAKTDKERFALADKIMRDIIPALDRIYDRIREWEKTGTLPAIPTAAAPVADGAKLVKRLQSLRAQRSRIRKELAAAKTDAERVKKAEEIQKRETEIAEVEAQLNAA